MRKRLWPLAHTVLTLACVGCCAYLLRRDRSGDLHQDAGRDGSQDQPQHAGRLSGDADIPLRHFHQVRWLGGDYELPAGQDHCAVALMLFEDGRPVGARSGWVWSVPDGGHRAVPYLVMWGPTATGPRSATFTGGVWTGAGGDFLTQLDGPLGRSYGTSDSGEMRGFRVIGYAASKTTRRGHEAKANIGGETAREVIESRRHVAVLGVRPCGSKEEAEQSANRPAGQDNP